MKTPADRYRHDVALFRYGLIADIMTLPPGTERAARGPRQGGTRPCDPGQHPDPGFRPDAQGLDPHLRARRL